MPVDIENLDALAAIDFRKTIPAEQLMPVITSAPFIPSRSLLNLRDAGAVPGSAIPKGRFFRSGTLEYAVHDPEALAWLAGHVRHIYDLRKEGSERAAEDPTVEGVENVWLPSRGTYPTPPLADFAHNEGIDAWKEQYMNVAVAYSPTFKVVLEQIRDKPREPMLFHCSGK